MLKFPESTYGILEKAPRLATTSLPEQLFADTYSQSYLKVIVPLSILRVFQEVENKRDVALREATSVCERFIYPLKDPALYTLALCGVDKVPEARESGGATAMPPPGQPHS